MAPKTLRVKRAYEEPSTKDGYRVLVDALWPRGVSKDTLRIDLWMKEIAPSTKLRKWYHQNPEKWDHFKKRYKEELMTDAAKNRALEELKTVLKDHHNTTLIFSSRNLDRNNAIALQEFV